MQTYLNTAKKVDQTEMKWNRKRKRKMVLKKTIEKDRMNQYDHHETCKEVMKMKGNKAEDRWSQDMPARVVSRAANVVFLQIQP